jgi:hypothetical protein
MTTIVTEATIHQPVSTVFDYVTTPAHWLAWHPSSIALRCAADQSLSVGIVMKRLAPILLPLLLSACVLGQVGEVMHPTVSGSLIVHRADGSELRWTPDRCASGDLEYFVGFNFLSSKDAGQLRALLDPIVGPAVRWKSGAGESQRVVVLHRDDCTKLDLEVQRTAFRVNDVREFAGHIELQCSAADGTRIEGRIDVDHCH